MLPPALPDGVIKAVGRISIRGRMALAARCFDDVCAHFGLDDPEIRRVSEAFWSFGSTGDFGAWERELPDSLPEVQEVIDMVIDPSRGTHPSWDGVHDPVGDASPVYLRMPLVVSLMAVLIYDDIGRGNLYSGVAEGSPGTWKATLRVLAMVRQLGLPLPDLGPFLRSPITEAHGFGDARPREFYTA